MFSRLAWLLRRRKRKDEMRPESLAHLETGIAERIAPGISPDEARAEAHRVGNTVPAMEASRRVWSWGAVDELGRDLRYAVRSLRRSPGFTLVAVVALAVGIGANAAIFSVANAVLFRPLPYADADRLVFIRSDVHGESGHAGLGPGEIRDLKEQSRLLENVGWILTPAASLTGDSQMEQVPAARVSDEFFSVLDIHPVLGRLLQSSQDSGPYRARSILISGELWRSRYHGDPAIVGRSIEVNNYPVRVAGVLPEGLRMYLNADSNVPPQIDIWFPGETGSYRGYHYNQTVARLRKGVTFAQAQAEIDAIAARMIAQYPQDYPDGFRMHAVPLRQDVVKPARDVIIVLLGTVGCVLLIACANVANLLLARGSARRKEVAIRSALGAGRARVVQQLLTESVVLAAAGGTLGFVIANEGIRFLLFLRPASLPRQNDIVIDTAVALFAAGVSVVSCVLFGLAPAIHTAGQDVGAALKEATRSSTPGAVGMKVRSALVAVQVALSLVLLIGTGLMVRSFQNIRSVHPGFEAGSVLTFKVGLDSGESPRELRMWRFYEGVAEAIRNYPGVASASGIGRLPLDNRGDLPDLFALPDSPNKPQPAEFCPVLPGYYRTMKIPLVAGRDFTGEDNEKGADVVIVDERFAARTWPGESAIGKKILVDAQLTSGGRLSEVIGVVGHVQFSSLRPDDRPQIYVPYRNNPTNVTMVVRAHTDPLSLAAPLKRMVEAMGGGRPVWDIRLMTDYVATAMADTTFTLVLLGLMSGVALLLSVIGIYGVVSYSIAERMREFAIRLALGAGRTDILRLAMRGGIRPAAAGLIAGILPALVLTRTMSAFLFDVEPSDVRTYVVICVLLLVSAAFASYWPVRRKALKTDPRVFLQ